jgi:hypothetical protein
MKLPFLGIALLVTVASCAPDEPQFGEQVTFGFISDYTLQTSRNMPVVDSCKRAFMLSGSMTVVVRDASTALDADGKLDITQFPDNAPDMCPGVNIPLFYRTGLLAVPVTGTPSDAKLDLKLNFVSGSTVYSRTLTYSGTLDKTGGSGTLTYSINGTTNGTIQTTAQMVIPVTLVPVTGAVKIEPRPKG